jgi:DNA-binding response OmpR family regulator
LLPFAFVPKTAAAAMSSKPPLLMMIDDSPADLSLLMEMMAHRQMRMHVAFNGEEGFNKSVLLQPDLILLDLVMPRRDGFSTCRLLKEHERTRFIPIIFLSAANEVEKRIQGLTLGGVDFIGKPFVEEEVIARVEVHLSLRRRPDDIEEGAGPDTAIGVNRRDRALVLGAAQLLRQQLREPPSLEELSRQLGCNYKRLNLAFQKAMGMTVFAWLREERLRQARTLLVATETPIASIADHLGYSTQANFSKAFRERFGCSPRELRNDVSINAHNRIKPLEISKASPKHMDPPEGVGFQPEFVSDELHIDALTRQNLA